MAKKNQSTGSDCPIGTIVMWGGQSYPPDWMVCDGSILKQNDYKDLFSIIQHNFGDVSQTSRYNPATDFFLPDLRGRFIRGVDDTVGITPRDPDRATRVDMQSGDIIKQQVGSLQNDEFKSHSHSYVHLHGRGDIASGDYWKSGEEKTGATGGKETRPINAYLYFIIKVK